MNSGEGIGNLGLPVSQICKSLDNHYLLASFCKTLSSRGIAGAYPSLQVTYYFSMDDGT